MKIMSHAKKRQQQRGIQELELLLAEMFGRIEPAPGGAQRRSMSRREADLQIQRAKKYIHHLERARKIDIIEKDGARITTYKRKH